MAKTGIGTSALTTGFSLLVLTLGLEIAHAQRATTATAQIGDLSLAYDTRVWTIDGSGEALRIVQLEEGLQDLGIYVAVAEGPAEGCSAATVLQRAGVFGLDVSDARATAVARPGFTLHIATGYLGCRNWAGSPVAACAWYEGLVHTFTSPGAGCHTPPDHDRLVIDLLSGLSVR